jgi:hypothetical protein
MALAIWANKNSSRLTTDGRPIDIRISERSGRDSTSLSNGCTRDARRSVDSCADRPLSVNTIPARRVLRLCRDCEKC